MAASRGASLQRGLLPAVASVLPGCAQVTARLPLEVNELRCSLWNLRPRPLLARDLGPIFMREVARGVAVSGSGKGLETYTLDAARAC